jgi:hypothetical protein
MVNLNQTANSNWVLTGVASTMPFPCHLLVRKPDTSRSTRYVSCTALAPALYSPCARMVREDDTLESDTEIVGGWCSDG